MPYVLSSGYAYMNKHLPGCLYFQCLVGCLVFFVCFVAAVTVSVTSTACWMSQYFFISVITQRAVGDVFHCV